MTKLTAPDNFFERVLITLYESTDTVATIDAVLRLLGEHYGVSRAYIFEDREDGSWCANTFEWCAEGISSTQLDLAHTDYEVFGGKEIFMRQFGEDGIFFCPDSTYVYPELRSILDKEGIRAVLQCSLLDDGKFCGFIGYDDCSATHEWTQEQTETLSTISKLIGAFLLKARQREAVALSLDYQSALDNNAAFVYIIDRVSYEIIYNNRAIINFSGDSVGKICYQDFLGLDHPCEDCPMAAYMVHNLPVAVEVKRLDGMWLTCQASPLRWQGRDLMMITCIDITARKNADELLRQRGEEYGIVVKQSGKRVLRYDIKTGRAECYFEPTIVTGYGKLIDGFAEKFALSPRICEQSRQDALELFRNVASGVPEGQYDLKLNQPDGSYMWVRVDYTLIFNESGGPSHAIMTFFNNTAQFEKQLAYEQWHESVTELSAKSATFIEANITRDLVEYQMGIDKYSIVDRPFSVFLSRSREAVIFKDDMALYDNFFNRERLLALYSSGVTTDSVEYRAVEAEEPIWYRTDVSLVKYPTNDDVKALIIFTNIDRSHREMEYFARLASMDSLTGILNREATHDAIGDKLSLAEPGDLSALFMIDLDNFKQVNDHLGHQYGDSVLKSVAQALSEVFTDNDVVGRVGGDEFMAFFPRAKDLAEIEKRAGLILDALYFSAGSIMLTTSLGVSVCRGAEKTFDQLYIESDAALYEAKGRGKNQYCISSGVTAAPAARSDSSTTVQLKALLDYMDGGVVLAEVDGEELRVIYTSPSFFKALGRKPEDFGANLEKFFDCVHPRDVKSVRGAFTRTAKTGNLLDITYRVGEEGKIWRHMRAAKLPTGESENPRVIAVITDFTDAKRVEAELRISQERYRLALSQTDALLWEVDIPTHTLYQSTEVAASFGHGETIYPNAPDSMVEAGTIHPDSETEFRKMFADIYSGDEGLEYSILASSADGGYVWNRSSFRLVRDEKGMPIRAIGVVKKNSNVDSDMQLFEQEIRFGAMVEDSIVGTVRANITKNTVEYFMFPGLETRGIVPQDYDELCEILIANMADEDVRNEYRKRLTLEQMLRSFRQNENWLFSEFRRVSRDGTVRWSSSSITLLRQPLTGDLYLFLYVRDISVSKSWEAGITEPVQRDPSTMLFAKSTIRAIIENAISQNEDSHGFCAVSCIEIIGLDEISAKRGAKVANELLFTLGRSCRALLTGPIAVGRMSETQLVVFRADIGTVEQQQLRIESSRELILKVLRQNYPGLDIELFFGFAVSPISGADFEALYGKAALASRTAKQWSDNPIVGYSEQELSPEEAAQLAADSDSTPTKKTILVADDDEVARMIMRGVLDPIYNVIEAADGAQALEILRTNYDISLLFLDIVMPELNGWQVLEAMRVDKRLSSIPVIVVTADGETENVVRALDHGASDVIAKPYQPVLITSRARNTLLRSEAARVALQNRTYEMRIQQQATLLRAAERDELTGLYNKQAFYRVVRERINHNPNEQYIMLRFDIDRFKIYNELLGTESGDKLLRDVGTSLKAQSSDDFTFGRIESDHFACFTRVEVCDVSLAMAAMSKWFADYTNLFKLTASLGVYRIEDPNIDVSLMCDRALLAEMTVKESYTDKFAYYDSRLLQNMLTEQRLAGDIDEGINKKQICPYYQPQYNQVTGEMVGAEALARWIHPELGFISPGSFIPVFENNGLITKLDAYLWEEVCIYLRRRLDEKQSVVPISVNISRRDLYRLNLVEHFSALVKKYRLTPDMLRLEITESAYMDDPQQLIDTTRALQNAGFFIEMDDFGSGYSSLNTLKNVPVDLLKLDMKFLEPGSGEGSEGKSGIVLNSIITMAGWLNLPVLAEGVETARQAGYLRTLGCDLIQGYLFSKPLPEAEFSALLDSSATGDLSTVTKMADFFDNNEFWNPDSQATVIFNSFVGAAGIFEYCDGTLTAVRVNDKFFELDNISRERLARENDQLLNTIHPNDKQNYIDTVSKALLSKDDVYTEARWERWSTPGEYIWLSFRIRKIGSSANRYLLYVAMDNITERKSNESKLRMQTNLLAAENERSQLLLEQLGMGTVDYDCLADYFVYRVKTPEGSYHTVTHENYLQNISNESAAHPNDTERICQLFKTLMLHPCRETMDFDLDVYGTGYISVRIHLTSIAGSDGHVSRIVGLINKLGD